MFVAAPIVVATDTALVAKFASPYFGRLCNLLRARAAAVDPFIRIAFLGSLDDESYFALTHPDGPWKLEAFADRLRVEPAFEIRP